MQRVGSILGIALLILATAIGCSDPVEPEDQKVFLNTSFFLDHKETATVESENLKLTFTKIIRDDRCPANAICVWPGTAQIELRLDFGGSNQHDFTIDLLAGADSIALDLFSVDVQGYNIRFESLQPYPGIYKFESSATSPEPPRVTAKLRITKTSLQSTLDGVVRIADIDPVVLRLDPYQLDSVWVVGDTLMTNVSYSGGCARHYFFLQMTPAAFVETNPVQANLYVQHFSNRDFCDGWYEQTLRFDISKIRYYYEQVFGGFDTIRLNVYDYFENTPGDFKIAIYAPVRRLLPVEVGSYWIYDVYDYREIYGTDGYYTDTVRLVGTDFIDGKRWWYLDKKQYNPAIGFSSFSYRADTLVTLESCGSYWIEGRHWVPLNSGSYEYVSTECPGSDRLYADVHADTTYYEWCRYCSDAGTIWKVIPGIGVVSGKALMWNGTARWTLTGYGVEEK